MIPSHDPVAVLATLVACADLPLQERLRLFDWLLEEHPAAIHNIEVLDVGESLLQEAGWQRLPTAVCAEGPNVHGECGGRSGPGAIGWRAFLGTDDEVYAFCPACAEKELDEA
jgi:hypothetical protein